MSLAALSLLIVGLALPVAVAAAAPASWGWVVARHATTAHYVPAAKDQGSSGGGHSNSVTRLSPGNYQVDLPGVDTGNGGDVQVSALGSSARFCNASQWGPGESTGLISLTVLCFNLSGSQIDSAFTALYVARGFDSTGVMAYAWADQPTSTDYSPHPFYQVPGSITIHRSAPGSYVVRIPTGDATHGNIQVTGYGSTYCKAGDSDTDGSAMLVAVICPAGDAQFEILYTKGVGMTSVHRAKAAYLRTQPVEAGPIQLPAAFRYSSTGSTPQISHTGEGTYVVTLPGMPKGGYAKVTARGNTYYVCWLTKIRTSGTPQKIGVKCTTNTGSPQDTAFDLSYTK